MILINWDEIGSLRIKQAVDLWMEKRWGTFLSRFRLRSSSKRRKKKR